MFALILREKRLLPLSQNHEPYLRETLQCLMLFEETLDHDDSLLWLRQGTKSSPGPSLPPRSRLWPGRFSWWDAPIGWVECSLDLFLAVKTLQRTACWS